MESTFVLVVQAEKEVVVVGKQTLVVVAEVVDMMNTVVADLEQGF